MTDATVRRLLPGDAELYRTIRLLALRTDPESFGSTFEAESSCPLPSFADRLASSAVFSAFVGGEVVGMAGFKREDGPQEGHKGFVWGVFVRPEHRRRGLARLLMAAVLAHADAAVEMLTLSVTAGLRPATALYEALGFRTYGILPRSLCQEGRYLDEVMMVRTRPGNERQD